MGSALELSYDADGPHLLVAVDELPDVRAWLVQHSVPFDEDPEASTSCAGPVVGMLRFPDRADLDVVRSVLAAFE